MTTTAMTKGGGAAVAISNLNRDQVELLKRTICKGATDDELALFLQRCASKRLDPFSGQIHAVKRKEWDPARQDWIEKMTIQEGIDGFRLSAERTGERDGEDEPEWCGEDGVWRSLWTSKAPPFAARVRVWRKGHARPYTGLATWSFYVQTFKDKKTGELKPNRMWERGGPHMLAKCAEALALRKAFPDELSDVYAPEEMAHADEPAPAAGSFKVPAAVAAIGDGRVIEIDEGAADSLLKGYLEKILETTTITDLTALGAWLNLQPAAKGNEELRVRFAEQMRRLRQLAARKEADAAPQHDPATGDSPPPDDAPPAGAPA